MTELTNSYRKIYFWYIASTAAFLPVIFFPKQKLLAVSSIIFGLILTGILLYQSVLLFKKTPGKNSLSPVILGALLIAGGSFFDLAVTVLFSPDLSEEANPVVISLLYHDISLWIIYFFMLFYQVLEISIDLFLWACFLKTYPNILKSIPYVNFFTTIKCLLGCGKMTRLDFLLGRNIQYSYLVPFWIFIIIMGSFIHWYAVMEWLKIIPVILSTSILSVITLTISALSLLLISHFKIKNYDQDKIKGTYHYT